MPVIPENGGISALAAIIQYAVEVKMWNEENDGEDSPKKSRNEKKLNGIAAHIRDIFRQKISEVQEIQ